MSAIATLAATGASIAAVGWLKATDPKRRRAFGIRPSDRPAPRYAWSLVLLPGLFLPIVSGASGFVLWFGATAVLGWALVTVPPGGLVAWSARTNARGAMPVPHALEARVAALEAEVAELRAELAPASIERGLAQRR